MVLESANTVLYWGGSILNNKTRFDRPDTVLINRENKTAFVTDIAVPLTNNLSNTQAEKITKHENLALQVKNIRKLNKVSIYPLLISE
jgi:hypothetical protein